VHTYDLYTLGKDCTHVENYEHVAQLPLRSRDVDVGAHSLSLNLI